MLGSSSGDTGSTEHRAAAAWSNASDRARGSGGRRRPRTPLARVLDVLELLERKVGVDLLDRSAHPVVPAEAGRRFLPDARAAPAAADRAVAGLEAYRRDLHGVLRLGFMSAATGTHTRRILDLVAREAPDVTVQLVQLAWHEQASAVRSRTVDTALVRPPTADDDGLRLDLVRLEPRVVALPAGHRLAALVAVPRRAARTVGEG